jgi:hypothetical protein
MHVCSLGFSPNCSFMISVIYSTQSLASGFLGYWLWINRVPELKAPWWWANFTLGIAPYSQRLCDSSKGCCQPDSPWMHVGLHPRPHSTTEGCLVKLIAPCSGRVEVLWPSTRLRMYHCIQWLLDDDKVSISTLLIGWWVCDKPQH